MRAEIQRTIKKTCFGSRTGDRSGKRLAGLNGIAAFTFSDGRKRELRLHRQQRLQDEGHHPRDLRGTRYGVSVLRSLLKGQCPLRVASGLRRQAALGHERRFGLSRITHRWPSRNRQIGVRVSTARVELRPSLTGHSGTVSLPSYLYKRLPALTVRGRREQTAPVSEWEMHMTHAAEFLASMLTPSLAWLLQLR
jgi:hypothetical protein